MVKNERHQGGLEMAIDDHITLHIFLHESNLYFQAISDAFFNSMVM